MRGVRYNSSDRVRQSDSDHVNVLRMKRIILHVTFETQKIDVDKEMFFNEKIEKKRRIRKIANIRKRDYERDRQER